MIAKDRATTGRRRVPRRNFEFAVGVLLRGQYTIERAFQVGEGGIMICTPSKVAEGCQILTTFYLISGPLIIVRGVVRSVIPAQGKLPERYGLEFLNLSFHFKREIRNFVAAATYIDGNTSL